MPTDKAKRTERIRIEQDVDSELGRQGGQVSVLNRRVRRLKTQLDEFMSAMNENTIPKEHRTVVAKITALKRLAAATKIGLDRSKIHLYDLERDVARTAVLGERSEDN